MSRTDATTTSIRPDGRTLGVAAAVLLAGLVYPLAFGTVGGAVGSAVADRR